TITNNHIYNNSAGINFSSGATATVNNNNFEGGASPDNAVDIMTNANDATPIVGGTLTGNTFAGTEDFHHLSAQNLTALRGPFGTNTYNVAGVATTNDFTIESRVFHKVDNASSGLITWNPNNLFVVPVPSPTATDNDYTVIANALAAVSSGQTIS